MKNNKITITCAAIVSIIIVACTIGIVQKQNRILKEQQRLSDAVNAENNALEIERARVQEVLRNRAPLGFQSKQIA